MGQGACRSLVLKTNLGPVIHKSLVYQCLETRLCTFHQSGSTSLSPETTVFTRRVTMTTETGVIVSKSDLKVTQMQHCAFIFAHVKLSRRPRNCDSRSHIVYIKTLLRKAFIFSPSYWWFRILLCLRSIFII